MEEYIVEEDRKRLLLFSILYLIATLILLGIAVFFFAINLFIVSFIAITVVWFTIKYFFRYAGKLWKHTPICRFDKKGVTLYCLSQKEKVFKYKDIKEVKVMRDQKSVKFFFAGKGVTHPSGFDYMGVVYPFKKQSLEKVEFTIKKYLKNNNVVVEDICNKGGISCK